MSMTAIDLFAGAGGFSTGASMAGVNVIWAANHWQHAVEIHAKNHPQAAHLCQDLHQANWEQVPDHDLMLASPSCTGHTRARGKEQSHHDAARSTAWAVVSAAECKQPPMVIVENVPEFLNWSLYPAWEMAINALGYSIAKHCIDSADHGVPQHRLRLFLVLTKSKHPIDLALPKREHVGVGNVIQWDQHRWSPVNKPKRSQKTLARIQRARRDGYGSRFVMPYYSSGSGLTGRSLDRPIGTITTRDRWAVVDGDRMRMLQTPEYRAIMGFPSDYALPAVRKDAIFMLGNAVTPPAVCDLILALRAAA